MSEVEGSGSPEVEKADDLFGRWLAHHSRQVTEDEKDLAVESSGPDLAGARPTKDMDRQVPGFEPVIMPSVRKRQEQGGPVPRRGLRRPRAQSGAAEDDAPLDLSPTAGSAASSTPPSTPLSDAAYDAGAPPAPAEGRRPSRSTSGEQPDWLRDLRDPAPAGAPDAAVPEVGLSGEPEVAAPEPEAADDVDIEVIASEAVEPEPKTADVLDPEVIAPEVTAPEPETADVVNAQVMASEAAGPEPKAADVVDAEVLAPEAAAPEPDDADVVDPEVVEPEAAARETDDADVVDAEVVDDPVDEVPDVADADIVDAEPAADEAPAPEPADVADLADAEIVDVEVVDPGVVGAEPTNDAPLAPEAVGLDEGERQPAPEAVDVAETEPPDEPEPALVADPAAEHHDVGVEHEPAATDPQPTADLDWLSIIRDPGSRYAPSVPVDAEAEPEPTDEPSTEPDAPAAPTTRSTWVDRLRGPAPATDAAPSLEAPETSDAQEAADVPDVPEPEPEPTADWRSTFRDAVVANEAAEAEAAAEAPQPEPVVHLVKQARSTPTSEQPTAATPATPAATAKPAPPEKAETPRTTRTTTMTPMPDVHEFAARRTARRLVTALLAVGVLITAYLASLAYDQPSQSSIALAALAAFVTAIVWAVRASTVVTTLVVREGTLEVTRAGTTDTFDLTSAQTPVELVGVPGERGWKALFVRQGKPPYELTASDVDPTEFTRVVRYHRPGEPTSTT